LCRIPVVDNRSACGFATTAVAVTNNPLPSVEVLQIVTSGGVVINCDPFELVVVKTTGIDRVKAGFVVIVLISLLDVSETTVTEVTVEPDSDVTVGPGSDVFRAEVSVIFDAVLLGVDWEFEAEGGFVGGGKPVWKDIVGGVDETPFCGREVVDDIN